MFSAIRGQAGRVEIRTPATHHDCADVFAVQRIGDAENRGFGDAGMSDEYFFDMLRRDLLAAAVDLVLDATLHHDATVAVDHTEVAGAKPAIHKRCRVRCCVSEIPPHHGRSFQPDLTATALRPANALVIPNPHRQAGWRPNG